MNQGVKRKLAAIVSADVVGWSRLMGEGEARTLAQLKSHRDELIDPELAKHEGRIVSTAGDSLLVEFPSATQAVACCLAVQEGMVARNADVPAERRMVFRVGVNLGEVIVDGDDIHGDGVNIAARLQALAKPEQVLVSDDVMRQIRGRLDVASDDMGPQELKNIAEPVRAWQVNVTGARESAIETATAIAADDSAPKGAVPGFGGKPAVAILPFDNMSDDPGQEHFADGITEDLTTALSLWRTMPVIARNSTFTYKGRSVNVKEAGRELGARYIVEGSVRKAGERVRINAQLIDTESGAHLWAEKFDRELDDVFAVQDEITEHIVGAISPELTHAEMARVKRQHPTNLSAWELTMRAISHHVVMSREDIFIAADLFRQATEADPNLAIAYGWRGANYLMQVMMGMAEDPPAATALAIECSRRGVEADPQETTSYAALSACLLLTREYEEALEAGRTGVSLNPSNAIARFSYGNTLNICGEPARGVAEGEIALRLSPNDPYLPVMLATVGTGLILLDQAAAAVRVLRKSLQIRPGNNRFLVRLAAAEALAGNVDAAREAIANIPNEDPVLTRAWLDLSHALRREQDRALFLEGLEAAGWPGN